MSNYANDREIFKATEAELKRTDDKYPCTKCERKCGKPCTAWEEWFGERWRAIRAAAGIQIQ